MTKTDEKTEPSRSSQARRLPNDIVIAQADGEFLKISSDTSHSHRTCYSTLAALVSISSEGPFPVSVEIRRIAERFMAGTFDGEIIFMKVAGLECSRAEFVEQIREFQSR